MTDTQVAAFHVAWADISQAMSEMSMVASQGGPNENNQMLIGSAATALRRAAWRLNFGALGDDFFEEEVNRTKTRFLQSDVDQLVLKAIEKHLLTLQTAMHGSVPNQTQTAPEQDEFPQSRCIASSADQ